MQRQLSTRPSTYHGWTVAPKQITLDLMFFARRLSFTVVIDSVHQKQRSPCCTRGCGHSRSRWGGQSTAGGRLRRAQTLQLLHVVLVSHINTFAIPGLGIKGPGVERQRLWNRVAALKCRYLAMRLSERKSENAGVILVQKRFG